MRCNYNNNILFYIIIMTCFTTHPRITSFYEANPHISFEAMNLLIIDMMEKTILFNQEPNMIINNQFQQLLQTTNDNMSNVTTMVTTLQQLCTSQLQDKKGPQDTIHMTNGTALELYNLFTKMFPIADIKKAVSEPNYQTLYMKRFRKQPLYVCMIDEYENIGKDKMVSALREFGQYEGCGIFISQNTGFVDKSDFQIDVHNNNIVVYIHEFCKKNTENNDNTYKLQLAIQMIDHFMEKWGEIHNKDNNHDGVSISKEILEKINNEYQLFLHQKVSMCETIKDMQKKLNQQVDEIKFPFLEGYLTTHYCAPVRSTGLKCDICSKYNANNLKALAAHKRGCLRKHPSKIQNKENQNATLQNVAFVR